MKKYRIRFSERVHEDGVMAIEVVIGGDFGPDTAIAMATLQVDKTGQVMPWVEWVRPEGD